MKPYHGFTVVVIGIALAWGTALADWGTVTAGSTGATLENEVIKVTYGFHQYNGPSDGIYNITGLYNKAFPNENNAGYDQVDGVWYSGEDRPGILQSATVDYNGTDRKTVKLVYSASGHNVALTTKVSIYPKSPFVEIEYVSGVTAGPIFETVDISKAGGSAGPSTWIFQGGSAWKRGYVMYEQSYYNCPESGDPRNGGSLNYKGFFVAGVYNSNNKRGWGRVTPVNRADIIKLLPWGGGGLETFIGYGCQQRAAYKSYIYVYANGDSGAVQTGRKVADFAAGGPNPWAGTSVSSNLQPQTADKAPAGMCVRGTRLSMSGIGDGTIAFYSITGAVTGVAHASSGSADIKVNPGVHVVKSCTHSGVAVMRIAAF